MPKVIFQANGLDASEDVTVQTNDIMQSLLSHFNGKLPDNTRIYHEQVCQANDVTPCATCIEKDIQKLQELEGTVYVVTHPQFFLFGLTGILGTLLKVFILGLISYLLRPKPAEERNTGDQSPNNGLSDRVNSARLKERIPDIYGEVRSTPDMIAKPYFRFENHREVEYAYMCVGRGEFEITDVKDDITPIEDISGVSYGIYGPNTSPNSGVPQEEFGTAITERVWAARKSNAVNGQTLRAPNSSTIDGDEDIAFNSPDGVSHNNGDLDFEEYFAPGDNLVISNTVSGNNSGTGSVNLDGTYEILSVTNNSIALVNPGLVNANWDTTVFNTGFTDARLATNTDKWVGPFVVEKSYRILCNFIAANGLYTDDGEKQYTMGANIEIEIQRLDSNGDPIGPLTTHITNINGSAELQNARLNSGYFLIPGQTIAQSKQNKWQVRCRRVTETPEFDDRRVVDEIQWRDLYGMEYVTEQHFGDVTTVQVRTPATQGALSIKQRKFNCNAKRLIVRNLFNKNSSEIVYDLLMRPDGTTTDNIATAYNVSHFIPVKPNTNYFGSPVLGIRATTFFNSAKQVIPGGIFTGSVQSLVTSPADAAFIKITYYNSAHETFQFELGESSTEYQSYSDNTKAGTILKAIATDPKLGAMSSEEIDSQSISEAMDDIESYFGTAIANRFNYTFDQKNTSAEEMIQSVARAAFCTAFRQGQLLKLHFERQTDLSVLQFNHRNKIPNTELRSVRFGNSDDNDGVDFEWVDPEDGAIQTFQLPIDGSANNPKSIEINGINSETHAYFHAWREFQKIVHRNVAVEFDATAEAITLTLNQKILVADNTRGDTWDGQITYQDGVTLFLSQLFEGVVGTDYTIHLQHYDGQVEPLDIVGFGENNVTVASAPRLPLVIDNDKYANTTYIIVENNKKRPTAFLVQEVSPKDSMSVSLSAVNYDDRYYEHDTDFIDGTISEDFNSDFNTDFN